MKPLPLLAVLLVCLAAPAPASDHFAALYSQFGENSGPVLGKPVERWFTKEIHVPGGKIAATKLVELIEAGSDSFTIDTGGVKALRVDTVPAGAKPLTNLPSIDDCTLDITEGTHPRKYWLDLLCTRLQCDVQLSRHDGSLLLTRILDVSSDARGSGIAPFRYGAYCAVTCHIPVRPPGMYMNTHEITAIDGKPLQPPLPIMLEFVAGFRWDGHEDMVLTGYFTRRQHNEPSWPKGTPEYDYMGVDQTFFGFCDWFIATGVRSPEAAKEQFEQQVIIARHKRGNDFIYSFTHY